MAYSDARVRQVGGARRAAGGDYVLYWIQAYRRLEANHALDEALRRAEALRRPLVVYEGLRLDYPWASARPHRFVLEGMRDSRAAAVRLGLTYWPFVEGPCAPARGLLRRLAARAALIVTDDFPCFIVPEQTAALAAHAAAPIPAVNGNGVVPLSLLGSPVSAAAHLRPRIHRAFAEAWAHRAARRPRVGRAAAAPVTAPFPLADLDDLDRLMAALPLDATVPPVAAKPGGAVAANRRLAAVAAHQLAGIAERRSHPAPPDAAHASGLAPHLHFGHISIETVVERVLATTGRWSAAALRADAVGRREDFYTRDPDVASFLDQAITWRDLGYHWHAHRRTDTERLDRALPAWARHTLGAHRHDARAFTYTVEEWQAAATHDPLWNAAQRELVATGSIHNYLRMLWGKKVIEWSESPEEAYRTLVHLNNRYALDGRDPNSWTGILWCFGLFDRPWGPERPVLGTVRHMSSENAARKFRLGPYLAWAASLPPPPAEKRRGPGSAASGG